MFEKQIISLEKVEFTVVKKNQISILSFLSKFFQWLVDGHLCQIHFGPIIKYIVIIISFILEENDILHSFLLEKSLVLELSSINL